MAQYHIGPLYTPPRSIDRPGGPLGTLHAAGRRRRRELARRQLRSRDEPPLHSFAHGGVHAAEHSRQSRAVRPEPGGAREGRGGDRPRRRRPAPPAAGSARGPARLGRNRGPEAAREHFPARDHSADQAAVRSDHGVRHEYGRDALAESRTPRRPTTSATTRRSRVSMLSRLGAYGRIFIGTLTTKTLRDRGRRRRPYRMRAAQRSRCYAPMTRKRARMSAGQVEMPAKQTGSPMTYLHDGKQYIVGGREPIGRRTPVPS